MNRELTTREKTLLLVLAVLVIALGYASSRALPPQDREPLYPFGAPLYAVCGAYGYDRARGFLVDGGIYPVALRLYRRRSARVL